MRWRTRKRIRPTIDECAAWVKHRRGQVGSNGRIFTVVFLRDDKKVATKLTATNGEIAPQLVRVK